MDEKKNPSYSKLMMGEGMHLAVDADGDFKMELPDWADEKKIALAQRFFLLNINALARALFMGLMATASAPTILNILQFTKQSSTPATAYKRFKANELHAQVWYKNPITPGSRAWKSLETVRKIHVMINRRAGKADKGFISQTDMALTQFLFMGFGTLMPEHFGVVGSQEQFEAFSHFWRLIGYMLGIEDRFNCCGETLGETRRRLRSIAEDMFRPPLSEYNENFNNYTKIVSEGWWHSDPSVHYDSIMFLMKRALKVPGFYYFESEAFGDKQKNEKIIDGLSFYSHFRIIADIVIYENLCQIFIFRWICNISRFVIALIALYPILAVFSFGRRIAFVEIMKK